jgi:hypothetical protein
MIKSKPRHTNTPSDVNFKMRQARLIAERRLLGGFELDGGIDVDGDVDNWLAVFIGVAFGGRNDDGPHDGGYQLAGCLVFQGCVSRRRIGDR